MAKPPMHMLSTRLLRVACDSAGKVGVVIFEHTFAKFTSYTVQASPVNSSKAELMHHEEFPAYDTASECFRELLTKLGDVVGPLHEVEQIPPELLEPVAATTIN